MRYAIISDIHANQEALEAVVESSRKVGVDQFLCLGDIVGYGARPTECLEMVQDLGCRTVAGNHDFAVVGKIDIDNFNSYAKEATIWTREQLSETAVDYLRTLPLVEQINDEPGAGFTIVHGTLYSPELFDYIQTSYDAHLSMCEMPGEVCFLGHSHIPVSFIRRRFITYSIEPQVTVDSGGKFLVNVGSVGQPRDNNPQASYAIFDTTTREITIRRVGYDIDAAAIHIRDAGLPDILGERLRYGR